MQKSWLRHWFLGPGLLVLALFLIMAVMPRLFTHYDPFALDMGATFQAPSGTHLFGTDEAGRDLFARIVYGTRYSLLMSLSVVLMGAAFGTLVGLLSGVIGGKTDEVLMRIVDLFLSYPLFVLALAIASVLGRGIITAVLSLVIIWWPSYARLVRGMVLSLRERLHVEAAYSLGAPTSRIIRLHIMPFVVRDLLVRVTTDVGNALVAVNSLSFLGLGVSPPSPEWGLIIADSRTYLTSAWWYPFFPGVAIALVTLIFSLVGDAISDLMEARFQGA